MTQVVETTVEVPMVEVVERVVEIQSVESVQGSQITEVVSAAPLRQRLPPEVVQVTEIGADLPAESIAPIIVQSAASPPGPAQLVVNSHIPEPLPVMNSVAPTFVQEPAMLTYANPTTTTCGATTFVQEPAMQTYPNSTT